MAEEYELVSVTPVRKLEKRLELLEKGSPGYNAVLKDLVEMMKENQRVVDDLIKTNSELIAGVGQLSQHLAGLTGKFDEFMESIEVAGSSEEPKEWANIKEEAKKMADINKEFDDRLKKMERQMRLAVLSKYYYQQPQGQASQGGEDPGSMQQF